MRIFKKLRTAMRFTIELRDHLGIVRRFSGKVFGGGDS